MLPTSSTQIPRNFRLLLWLSILALAQDCAQVVDGGVYDFAQGRYGERRGSWTPGEWLGVVLLIMTICLGLALSVGLCYYVKERKSRRSHASISGASSLVVEI